MHDACGFQAALHEGSFSQTKSKTCRGKMFLMNLMSKISLTLLLVKEVLCKATMWNRGVQKPACAFQHFDNACTPAHLKFIVNNTGC